jgi:hypothetical protein
MWSNDASVVSLPATGNSMTTQWDAAALAGAAGVGPSVTFKAPATRQQRTAASSASRSIGFWKNFMAKWAAPFVS